jgi:hypothetical protein
MERVTTMFLMKNAELEILFKCVSCFNFLVIFSAHAKCDYFKNSFSAMQHEEFIA